MLGRSRPVKVDALAAEVHRDAHGHLRLDVTDGSGRGYFEKSSPHLNPQVSRFGRDRAEKEEPFMRIV
jgi:hypothetical protein